MRGRQNDHERGYPPVSRKVHQAMEGEASETRSADLIARVLAKYPNCPIVGELVAEYRIAVEQALRVERTIHWLTKH